MEAAALQRGHVARFRGYSRSASNVPAHPGIRCHLVGCGCAWNTFVWVSEPLRCVWFEIPKNASSSFKAATGLTAPHRFHMHAGSPDSVLTAFPDFRRFAILREPVDRIRSVYRMFCRSDSTFRHRLLQALFGISDVRLSFAEFLAMAARIRNHHWEQTVRFLPAGAAGLVPFRMRHDFVPAFEAFFAAESGVSLTLPRLNATDAKPRRRAVPGRALAGRSDGSG